MDVRVHLISPPWAPIWNPSPQTGALAAWLERAFAEKISLRSYSAFLDILYRFRGTQAAGFYASCYEAGEALYMLIYHKNYLAQAAPLKAADRKSYLERINKELGTPEDAVTEETLAGLERATREYVEQVVVPQLLDDGVNVVGFSTNFNQIYSSLFVARLLRELAPGKSFLFVFGGFHAGIPTVLELFARLGLDGYTVFGEGELKLEAIVRDVLGQKSFAGKLSGEINGVIPIGRRVELYERDPELFKSELADLDRLPDPKYDEYFGVIKAIKSQDPIFTRTIPLGLPVEGSRGCFAKCEFCNLNSQWSKFRKQSADLVFSKAMSCLERYREANYLVFVDNVCDTFAEHFADEVRRTGMKLEFFMELRTHHPLRFWAKLARAGMRACQTGIEAVSAPLLKQMAKGTSVIQNLRAQKWLKELGVQSLSGLISCHPGATRADLDETRRVLAQLTHLDRLVCHVYGLGHGSPHYYRLPLEERKALRAWAYGEPPAALADFAAGYYCKMPPRYRLPQDERADWLAFKGAYQETTRALGGKLPRFTETRAKDGSLKIIDERFGRREFELKGVKARVYEACHEGLKIEMIEAALGLSRGEFEGALDELVGEQLILKADHYFLSLALRTKSEVMKAAGLE